MSGSYRYGDAVHAFFAMYAQGCPSRVAYTADDFPALLQKFAGISEDETRRLLPSVVASLWQVWLYLAELLGEVDRISLEPLFLHSGKRPDMVLFHQGHIYVIEVKTKHNNRTKLAGLNRGVRRTLHQQVAETAPCLRQDVAPDAPIHVYALIFTVGIENPAEPVWHLLDEDFAGA
jgi:hypothetical protein